MVTSRLVEITDQEIDKIKENSVPRKTKEVTKYWLKLVQGKIQDFSCFNSKNLSLIISLIFISKFLLKQIVTSVSVIIVIFIKI